MHRLRKRAKRLRYAAEFVESLHRRKASAAYLDALRAMQADLGALNDVAVAIAACRSLGDGDPRASFALGWLAARRDALQQDCRPALAAFVVARPFWARK